MLKETNVKILIGYHKPSTLFKSEILLPINGGRACISELSKDGKNDTLDIKWLINNTIGDDSGDNISIQNRYINEMTCIYWAWKNYDKLGNPDYIGFMQYAKHFIFNPYMEISRKEYHPDNEAYIYDEDVYIASENLKTDHILSAIDGYDCLCTNLYDFKTQIKTLKNCKEILHLLAGVDNGAFDIMDKVIRSKFQHFIPQLEEIENGTEYRPFNLFVMKKELFFEYANLMFTVLQEILDNIDLSQKSPIEKRTPGFCGEFITSMYINYLISKGYKVKPLKTAIVEKNRYVMKDIIQLFNYKRNKQKYIKYKLLSFITFGKRKQYYKEQRQLFKNKIKIAKNLINS